jgi:hypothetical protein
LLFNSKYESMEELDSTEFSSALKFFRHYYVLNFRKPLK